MILENLGYKLIALGLSILLWLYVNAERNPMGSRVIRDTISPRNLGEGLMLMNQTPTQTSLTIDGPQRILNALDADSLDTFIDCSGLGPGEHQVPIRYRLGEDLKGVVTVQLKDRYANIYIDQKISKSMEIEFRSLINPALGYTFGFPVINPPRATVSGLGKDVSKVVHLVAYLEAATPPTADIQKKVRLAPRDENGNEVAGVRVSPSTVEIKVPVKEQPVTRMLFVSPAIQGYPPPPHRIEAIAVVPDQVTLNGLRKEVEKVTVVSTEPIDVSQATETFTREVALKPLPGAITLDRERVRVTVKIAK